MMTWHLKAAALLAAMAGLAALSAPAQAQRAFELKICNKSQYRAAAAVSYQRPSEYNSDWWYYEGWLVVAPGECIFVGETMNQYVYMFATEHNNPDRQWSGDFGLCVQYPGPYEFVLHYDEDCPRNAEVEMFTEYYIPEDRSGFTLNLY